MKKVADLRVLGEKYGTELVDKLKKNIDFCEREKLNFKIEILDEGSRFSTVAFATHAYSYIYEVRMKNKSIFNEDRISFVNCEKVFKSMKGFHQAE